MGGGSARPTRTLAHSVFSPQQPMCTLRVAHTNFLLSGQAKALVPDRPAIASGSTCARRVLAEPKAVCAKRKSNPKYDLRIYFCRVLPLCCPVRGRGCAVTSCAPAGTMIVLALRVLVGAMLVPARRAISTGCTCARRVLAEPKAVCARPVLAEMESQYVLSPCAAPVLPCSEAWMCNHRFCSCRVYGCAGSACTC